MSRSTALAFEYVVYEVTREGELKTSLESRANALISAYTASIAAGIALAALVETNSPITEGAPLVLTCVGAGLAVAGLIAAVVALTPLNVGAIDEEEMRDLPSKAKSDPDTVEAATAREAELTTVLVDELTALRNSSKVKAMAVLIGTVFFVAAVILFAAGLTIAL
jgi:hypothetical protein